jgi:hypothetical protein
LIREGEEAGTSHCCGPYPPAKHAILKNLSVFQDFKLSRKYGPFPEIAILISPPLVFLRQCVAHRPVRAVVSSLPSRPSIKGSDLPAKLLALADEVIE